MTRLLTAVLLLAGCSLAGSAATVDFRVPQNQQRQKAQPTALKAPAQKASRLKAPRRAETIAEPIENPPGETFLYSESVSGFFAFWGSVFDYSDSGLATKISIDAENNAAYLMNPVSVVITDTYIRGDIDETGVTFHFPQCIGYDAEEGPVWVQKMESGTYTDPDDGEEYGIYTVVETDNFLHFTLNDGVYTMDMPEGTENGDIILGVTTPEGEWFGYGDYDIVLTPFTGELLTREDLPQEAVSSLRRWALTDIRGGKFVEIGTDDANIYIGGLFNQNKDAFVRGSWDGETAVLASEQYLGVDAATYHYTFFRSADIHEEYDEVFEDYFYVYDLVPEATLTSSSDGTVLTPSCSFMIGFDYEGEPYGVETFIEPMLRMQPEVISYVPAKPEIVSYEPWEEEYGWGDVSFNLPNINEDGYLLEPENMYWQLLLDGLPYAFDPELFEKLSEPMVDVPYGYDDRLDFITSGGAGHMLYFYSDFEQHDTMAIRQLYKNGDQVFHSDPAYVFGESRVKTIENARSLMSVYYDVTGRRVSDDAKGLRIRMERLDDGTTRVSKEMSH